jgi:phage replication initiation protein
MPGVRLVVVHLRVVGSAVRRWAACRTRGRREAARGGAGMTTPLSNTGVNGVRRLTRDEQLVLEGSQVKVVCAERQQGSQSGVVVDYLRVTVKRDAVLTLPGVLGGDDDVLTQLLAFRLAGCLGFTLGDSRNGRDFYEHTWTIVNAFGKEVASVSGGGENQRETFCLTLKGEACTFAAKGWERRVYEWLAPLEPRVTRVDLARDFLGGEVAMEEVVHCYHTGAFDYRNRRPSYEQHGRWEPEAVSHEKPNSRTFQVGQRESGKLMRAYEKGHAFKMLSDMWLRVEVELRNVNRIVPFEALVRPADFFAGAYDFCQMVLDVKAEAERIPTGKAVGERSVARFARWFENVVAPSIRAVAACVDSAEWADFLSIKHIHRRMPRGLAGLDHARVREGVREWVASFSEVAPANPASSV